MALPEERDGRSNRLAWTALGSALFVALAVVSEVVGGARANSPAPSWAHKVVPLAWPQSLRVLWWLAVAVAAYAFRTSLHRLGFPQRRLIVALSVAPFVAFAAGVALGAGWATWH